MPRKSKPHLNNRGQWRFRHDGTEYVFPKGTTKKTVEAKLAKLRGTSKEKPTGKPATVVEIVSRWNDMNDSSEWTRTVLLPFEAFAHGVILDRLDRELVKKYAVHLRRQEYAPSTIRKMVTYAAKVMQWAFECEYVSSAQFKVALPSEPKSPSPIPESDLADIFAVMGKDVRRQRALSVYRFMLLTGCRPGEACGLQWSQIDFERKSIRLEPNDHKTGTRTGKARVIYPAPEAFEILESLPRPKKWVFLSRLHKPYTPSGLRSVFYRCAKEVLGKSLRQYQLRHTFARLARDHHPPDIVRRLMGHASIATTLRYYDVDDRELSDAARKIDLPASLRQREVPARSGRKGKKNRKAN